MTVKEFEERFWEIEKMVIIVRADTSLEVNFDYYYERMLAGNSTLTDLKSGRLAGFPYTYVIFNGETEEPHGRTKLSSIRDSYN